MGFSGSYPNLYRKYYKANILKKNTKVLIPIGSNMQPDCNNSTIIPEILQFFATRLLRVRGPFVVILQPVRNTF